MNPDPPLWVGLAINLLVPLGGVIVFALLCRRMHQANIPSPPYITYLILFSAFGGMLVMGLTVLFWVWSGMASLGGFYLIFIAPVATAVAAFKLRERRTLTNFHRLAYIACIAYIGVAVVAFGAALVTASNA